MYYINLKLIFKTKIKKIIIIVQFICLKIVTKGQTAHTLMFLLDRVIVSIRLRHPCLIKTYLGSVSVSRFSTSKY